MNTPGTKWRPILVATVTAAVISVIAWFVQTSMLSASDGTLAEIVEAARTMQYRTLESRLSGAFPYQPLQPDQNNTLDPDVRRRLTRITYELMSAEVTPANRCNLGVTFLLLGKVDASVVVLEQAVSPNGSRRDVLNALRTSRDLRLLTVITAAYLERGRRTKNAMDTIAALETSRRAWIMAQTPENAWNHALALTYLQFPDAMRRGWTEYLRIDATSPWSREAQAHLISLQQPTLTESWAATKSKLDMMIISSDRAPLRSAVARFPQQMRIHVEDTLLPRWAISGNAQDWSSIQTIGQALAAEHGEGLIRQIVTIVEHAEPKRRQRLMNAYRDYATGKHLYEMRQPLSAIPKLNRAAHAFAEDGADVLASLADVFAASAMFVAESYTSSLRAATRGIRRLDNPNRYPSLLARLEWLRGLCNLALARPYESLRSYDRALDAMQRAGELDSVATLQNLRAEALAAVGDENAALQSRLAAVRTKNLVGGRNKSEQILAGLTRTLFMQGHADLALQFIDLIVAHPQFGDSADVASEVLLLRALILQKLGRDAEAKSPLNSARSYALKSGDARVNAAMLADIDAALALNATASDTPTDRLSRLTTALDHSLQTGNHNHRSRFLLYRARVFRELGKLAAAESDLRTGLAEVEAQRRGISSRRVRQMYFASSREVITELVDLLVEQRRAEDAFDVAESARSRGLLHAKDAIASVDTMSHERVMSSLRRGETLVSNFVLDDRVLTWIVTCTELRLVQQRISRHALEQLIVSEDAKAAPYEGALYRAVMAEADRTPITRCVFIPDSSLPPITLSTLKDASGAYLIEKYSIAYASSATEYIRSLKMTSRPLGSEPHVLTVAASSFDSALFPNLAPLPAVNAEVEGIAHLYKRVTSLVGHEATPKRFLSAATLADIVHFAGHAAGGDITTGATLVMAPDMRKDEAGLLYAQTIAEQKLTRTRLIVLSACGVTSKGDVDALPIGSIAYAFLSAGVPAVIATTRPIDDRIAADFMPRLHAALLRENDAAAALRSAQLTYIRSENPSIRHPSNWAAFRLYGHYEREVKQ